MQTRFYLLFSLALALSSTMAAQRAFERDAALAKLEKKYGKPAIVDEKLEYRQKDFTVTPEFDSKGVLISLYISHNENIKKLFTPQAFELLLVELDEIKPLGPVIAQNIFAPVFALNGMGPQVNHYKSALVDRCEIYKQNENIPIGIGWFQVFYEHELDGQVAKVEFPHAQRDFPCSGPKGEKSSCLDFESRDWSLAGVLLETDPRAIWLDTDQARELKLHRNLKLSGFGPLNMWCGPI